MLLEDYFTFSPGLGEWHRWAIPWPESVSGESRPFRANPAKIAGFPRAYRCFRNLPHYECACDIQHGDCAKTHRYHGPPTGSAGENQGRSNYMLQPPENKNAVPASNATTYTPVKTSSAPMEQATIGRSLVIKGDISGAESLLLTAASKAPSTFPNIRDRGPQWRCYRRRQRPRSRHHGQVRGNIICSDRLDIRSEGTVTGDVVVQRISVEDAPSSRAACRCRRPASRRQAESTVPATDAKPNATPPKRQPRRPERSQPEEFVRQEEGHERRAPFCFVAAVSAGGREG